MGGDSCLCRQWWRMAFTEVVISTRWLHTSSHSLRFMRLCACPDLDLASCELVDDLS